MRSSRILAVDLGSGHIACAVFAVGATGRLVLQQCAFERYSADPSHESRWIGTIAQTLGAIASREKLGGLCALTVPGHLALTKFIKTPSISPEKRGKIIAFEASENIPYPLTEVVWDHVVVSDDSLDLEVMLTAAKLDAMQSLCEAADAAGFSAQRATPSALALVHAFRFNYPEITSSVIVANIGARSTNLLFIDGPRFYVRTLALAGNQVTRAIAEELRIDFDQADSLKVQVLSGKSDLPESSPSRAAVHRAAAGFMGRLHLEITRSTVNHRRQTGSPQPVALYLTGGGSLIPELPAVLSDRLKLTVDRYAPFRHVECSADARAAGADSAAHLFADVVGLATRLVNEKETEASLLPPAITQAIAFRRRQPLYLAAAVLAAAALLPPIFYYHTRATRAEEQIRAVDSQLMPLGALQARNATNLERIESAKKQIAAIQGLVETKSNWINFFTDLQGRLGKVEDVWLDRLQVVRPVAADPAEAAPPADPAAAAAPKSVPLRLTLSGRLLDAANPVSKVSEASYERVKKLLASFAGSQFIAAVENERFDNTQPGLLRFDFTLVVDAKKPL